MEDNPALSPDIRARYAHLYSGVFYRRYVLGEWVHADGLVYPMFSKEQHVYQTHPRYERYYISVDYGTVNPCSMGLWGLCRGRWYRMRECYYASRREGVQKTDEQYYRMLETLAGTLPVEAVIVDPSAASFLACIREHGRLLHCRPKTTSSAVFGPYAGRCRTGASAFMKAVQTRCGNLGSTFGSRVLCRMHPKRNTTTRWTTFATL